MDRPAGDPHLWGASEWARYNKWEAAQAVPPMWGPYTGAEDYYSTAEFAKIMLDGLASYRLDLDIARQSGQTETAKFYQDQIAACLVEIRLREIKQAAQRGLFT